MQKAFSKARTLRANIISSTHGPGGPNRIMYEQEQEYTIRFIGATKRVHSLIILDLDENDKIVRLTDKWSGKDSPAGYRDYLRRFGASSVPWLISVPDY